MKRITAMVLVCVMVIGLCTGCALFGNKIKLGTSKLSITTEEVYKKGEITSADTDESQVGYYYSDDSLVDFDVYQWAKATGETLDGAASEEAANYGAEIEKTTINGHDVAYYYAAEESEGEEYDTVTYITEDGDCFVEIVFWLDGEGAEDKVQEIINTLR